MPEDTHYDEMKGILFRGATATALDFNTRVSDWIMLCRIEDGGIPAFRCYDSETEVLTEDGWKHFDEVEFHHKIATLNPETGMLEYQEPTNIINVLYKGKMYRVRSDQIDLLVTPTHNMFVVLYRSKRVGGRSGKKVTLPRSQWKFNLISAEKCFGKHVLYKKNAQWNGKNQDYFTLPATNTQLNSAELLHEQKIPMDEWLTFFGFWLAEGWTTLVEKDPSGFNYIIEISNYDINFLTQLKNLLASWGFHSHIRPPRLRIYNKQLYDYLRQFGKAYEKYVPKEIKALSSKHLKVFLSSYLKGDGYKNEQCLACSTSSEKLRDDMQEIALKVGLSANYSLCHPSGSQHTMNIENRTIIANHDNWRIGFIRRCKTPRFYPTRAKKENQNRFEEKWVDYDGFVGCVEVPNHVIYVRRNGKPVWCGNTGFARRPFKADDEYYVMGVCWLGANLVRSQWFRGVSEEDWEYMRDNSDDYQYLLKKYGKPGMLERTLKAPVVVV